MSNRQNIGENIEPHHSGEDTELRSDGAREERPSAERRRDEDAGLCANCELRESCERPRLPGGIWSCNDYSEL